MPSNTPSWKGIKHAARMRYWRLRAAVRAHVSLWLTRLRWTLGLPRQKPHGLQNKLIISLTSYPPRFASLLPTLQCLLRQDIKPDAIILWIYERDLSHLSPAIKALEQQGLTIKSTPEDLGPYKKIIPALLAHPDAIIVTADDDVYYRPHWLRDLLTSWNGAAKAIACHRGHNIRYVSGNQPRPYAEWEEDVKHLTAGTHLFPTGAGGILYPPGALPPATTDIPRFMALSPKADDLWLFWMARMNGCSYKLVENRKILVTWPSSQNAGLRHSNVHDGGNDRQIAALTAAFGWPLSKAPIDPALK